MDQARGLRGAAAYFRHRRSGPASQLVQRKEPSRATSYCALLALVGGAAMFCRGGVGAHRPDSSCGERVRLAVIPGSDCTVTRNTTAGRVNLFCPLLVHYCTRDPAGLFPTVDPPRLKREIGET